MYRNHDEDLQRLEEDLWEEDDYDEDFDDDFDGGEDDAEFIPYDVVDPSQVSVRNRDRLDRDLDQLSWELDKPEKKGSLRGLMVLAMVLLLAILAVLGWWILRFMGV